MDTNQFVTLIFSVIAALVASSGFWAYLQKRFDSKVDAKLKDDVDREAERAMLRGLAHDRITYLGMQYITRGDITQDEYENLDTYLFKPYEKLGGNGSAAKIMTEVRKLPLTESHFK